MARRATESHAVQLFPFLAVLVCTMGALIFLLLIMTRQIRTRALALIQQQRQQQLVASTQGSAEARKSTVIRIPAVSEPVEEQKPDEEEIAYMQALSKRQHEQEELTAEWTRKAKQLQRLRNQRRNALANRKSLVDEAVEQSEMMKSNVNKLELKLGAVAGEVAASNMTESAEAEQMIVEQQVAEMKKRLKAAQSAEATSENDQFQVIPFDTVSGTARRPILIECTVMGIRFLPENILITAADLEGFTQRANPLAAGTAALVAYWSAWNSRQKNPKSQPEPYPLLLVRPDGEVAYYVALKMLEPINTPRGYELIEDSTNLALPPVDPGAKAALETAVKRLMSERENIYRAALQSRSGPPVFGKRSKRGVSGSSSGSGDLTGDGEGFGPVGGTGPRTGSGPGGGVRTGTGRGSGSFATNGTGSGLGSGPETETGARGGTGPRRGNGSAGANATASEPGTGAEGGTEAGTGTGTRSRNRSGTGNGTASASGTVEDAGLETEGGTGTGRESGSFAASGTGSEPGAGSEAGTGTEGGRGAGKGVGRGSGSGAANGTGAGGGGTGMGAAPGGRPGNGPAFTMNDLQEAESNEIGSRSWERIENFQGKRKSSITGRSRRGSGSGQGKGMSSEDDDPNLTADEAEEASSGSRTASKSRVRSARGTRRSGRSGDADMSEVDSDSNDQDSEQVDAGDESDVRQLDGEADDSSVNRRSHGEGRSLRPSSRKFPRDGRQSPLADSPGAKHRRSPADHQKQLEPEMLAGRHWGHSEAGAAIGFERDVRVQVFQDKLIIAGKYEIPVEDGQSRQELFETFVGALDRYAHDWGQPPQGFFWTPRLKFIVQPEATAVYERTNSLMNRSGLASSFDFTKPDGSDPANSNKKKGASKTATKPGTGGTQ